MKLVLALALNWVGYSVAWAGPVVNAVALPGQGDRLGDVVVDADRQVHAVWIQDGGVFYAASADDGKSFGAPVRISPASEGALGGMFRGPQLSLGRDGTVHVIWYPDQSKLDKKDWGVRYARMAKGAGKFSEAVNLGHVPSDNYSLAADGKGQVAVVWTAGGVYAVTSPDDGTSFGAAQKLPGLDPCECCATAIRYDADGKLALLYRDKRNNDRNIFFVGDALNASGQKVQLNAENWSINACPMTGNSLVFFPQGGFGAGWEEKGRIFLSLAGSTTGQPRQVSVGEGKYPKVLQLPDGTIFIGWKHGNDALWKTFDANGAELASGTTGSTSSYDRLGAALNGKGEVLVAP